MNNHEWDAIIAANKERAKQRESSDVDAIDAFIKENAKQCGCGYEAFKFVHRVAFSFGMLNVPEFAKDAGVTEAAVRRYFGDDDASESEESAEPDTVDDPEAEHADATEIINNHVSLLEKDADNILDSADRDYNNARSGEPGMLRQLNAINHQLNILTHIIAAHARKSLKERED